MVAKKSAGKKRKSGVSVDFGGVESGGGRPCRDGRWKAYPTSCELKETDEGNEYLSFKWKVTSGPDKGAVIWDNCSLQPQALWRLKTLLEVWGEDVPDGAMDLDPDDMTGEDKEIVIEIANEKYRGKSQPRIVGFGGEESEDDGEEAEEEEEDEKPKKPKKPSKKDEEEEEEEDDDDKDEEEEEEEEKKPPKKPGKDERLGKKPKVKEGSKVTFEDDKGKTVRGTVTEIDGTTVKVEDKSGDEWELEIDQLELA